MAFGFGLSFPRNGGAGGAYPNSLFAAGEQGVWYDPSDLTTLFQDSAGTTPVTTAGQTVGLMLDKSKGSTFGANIATNGDFSGGATGWILGAGVTVSGGVASLAAGSGYLEQLVPTTAGRAYRVTATATGVAGVFCGAWDNANQSGLLNLLSGGGSASGRSGTFTFTFIASDTTSYVAFTGGGGLAATIDNVSVIPLPLGNHATQATSAQRPTYGIHPYSGVRNVANGSAAYSNATYWPASSVNSGITITRTAGSDATGAYIDVRYAGTATGGGTDVTFQYAPSRRAASIGDVYTCSAVVQRVSGVATNSSMSVGVSQEIAPSTYSGGTDSSITTSATPVTISATHTVTVGNQVRPSVNFGFTIGATIDVTYRIRELQFEKSATRTAYQANYSQYNVTEAGVASAYYLSFDGVDDGMVTSAIDFSATDAVTVFTGLRKLSDAARGVLVELGNNPGVATFQLNAPTDSLSGYSMRSTGSLSSASSIGGFLAPDTAVITMQGKISLDTAILRRNGVEVATSASDQGTGNYSNAILYIGRRGGSNLPLNGNIYSLIVRGAESTTGQITSTETWVNGKTGAY